MEMTKSELNKRYAELTGWKKVNLPTRNSLETDGKWWQDEKCKEIDLHLAEPPDRTEPNRFFGEVVPDMLKRGYEMVVDQVELRPRDDNAPSGYRVERKMEVTFWDGNPSHSKSCFCERDYSDFGIAGLHAAIKALEAMNGKS